MKDCYTSRTLHSTCLHLTKESKRAWESERALQSEVSIDVGGEGSVAIARKLLEKLRVLLEDGPHRILPEKILLSNANSQLCSLMNPSISRFL